MNLKRLFDDDDAVSPVIGVILMVAITVILAAVIASFVLGLGDQNNPAPTVSIDFDADLDNDVVTVTHEDGDEVESDNVFIRGEQIDTSSTFNNPPPQSWTKANGGTAITVQAGNSVDVDLTGTVEEYVIRIVWEDPDSDQTSTLDSDSGPDA